MRVLGIDPGLRNLGWGIIDSNGSRLTHVANGVCKSQGSDLSKRLVSLFEDLNFIFSEIIWSETIVWTIGTGSANPLVSIMILSNFFLSFKRRLTTKEIFLNYRNKDKNAEIFINDYKEKLARSLIIIITTIDPDAIVFGGGISNEIDFLDELKSMTSKLINEPNLKTVFLKPLYGDASGVRGAALLGRENLI